MVGMFSKMNAKMNYEITNKPNQGFLIIALYFVKLMVVRIAY